MSDNETKVNELNEALKELWDSLTDEQKEKAKECKSMDELMLLAGKMRIELPDELLEEVAGGLIVESKDDFGKPFFKVYAPFLFGYEYVAGRHSLEDAKKITGRRVSSEVISEAEFKRRRC